MIRLRVLGSVDLRDDDGAEIRSLLMQPKRLSLLLYLALARPRGLHRRDTVIGVFWPEAPPERGRASLNQAVHLLRRWLGADVIVGRGSDELGVSAEHLACDAWEFEAAATADPERALELYHGELAPGFNAAEAAEFERWLDGERKRMADLALAGVRALTEQAEAAGNLDSGISWARRALVLSPYDEPALRRLMELLARKGDRAAAIRACEEFSERLWNDVELRLSAATKDLLSRIRRDAGVSSAAGMPVESTTAVPETVPAPVPVPDTAHRAGPASSNGARMRRGAMLAAMVLIVLAAGGAAARRWYHAREAKASTSAATAQTRIAVLYFDVTDSTQQLRPLADGLTESLIDQLSNVDPLQVISRNGVRPFRGVTVSLDSIRRALEVPLVISGTVSRSGDSVRVTVQLVDAATGSVLRSHVIDRGWNEPFALMDALSDQVGEFLRFQVGKHVQLTRAREGTRNVAAWELLRRSRSMQLEASEAEELGQLSKAVGVSEAADSLLAQASRLDPKWIDPLIDRARLAEGNAWRAFVTGRGPAGVRAPVEAGLGFTERALSVHPGAAKALEMKGTLEYVMAALARPSGAAGDSLDRATERDLRAAIAADPQRARAWAMLSALELDRWHLSEAKADAQRAYNADSYLLNGEDVVNRLFMTSFELRQDTEARQYCDEFERRWGQRWEWAYCRLLLLAWADPRPDPRAAWKIYDEPSRVDGPAMRAATRPLLAMVVGAAVARAGMPDSARHIMAAARAAGAANPEVTRLEAAAQLILGDTAESRRLLAEYYARAPISVERRQITLRSRIFELPLRTPGATAHR